MAETYEQKKLKRCVICNHNVAERNNNRVFYYDSEFKDHHCDLCDALVKEAVLRNGSPWGDNCDWHQRKDWYTKTQDFEKTLDLDISDEAISKILDEEISE